MSLPRMHWSSSTPDLLTASVCDVSGARLYAIVEALPEGGWDWAAWAENRRTRPLHGECASHAAAVVAAERAAALLYQTPGASMLA